MDGHGFDAQTWSSAAVFEGRCATREDVEAHAAVFALGDTLRPQPLPMTLPQPVIWYEDDDQFAALIVQAELHETEEGQSLEVLGLLLPDGETAVAFTDDVDEVDATDPVWLELLDEAAD